jgi:hypothetical protein
MQCMPRVSVNGGTTSDRNKSMNQYSACHAVEYRPPPRFSRRRSSWRARYCIFVLSKETINKLLHSKLHLQILKKCTVFENKAESQNIFSYANRRYFM